MRSRPSLLGVALAAAALALALLPASGAAAAAPDGWVRVAHLSPDTKQVDVTLTGLAGGSVLYKLSDVGYGDVSPYITLAAGTYAIAMRPAGASATSTPVVTASVTVRGGKAATVAALGPNRSLETHVYRDDLASSAGSARVRVIQASPEHRAVTVDQGSTTVASDVGFAAASDYASVSAGTRSFTVSGGSQTRSKDLALTDGSVHTVFVLDTASGALTLTSVLDSTAAAVSPPTGGVATGGGGLAVDDAGAAIALAGGAGVLGLVAAVLLLRRPRRLA